MLKTKYIKKIILYDGSQLRSHFAYLHFNVIGDSLIAFRGPCEVQGESLVDLEDYKERSIIKSSDMLHFIGEFFDEDLEKTILKQRVLIGLIEEELIKEAKKIDIKRVGDDLFVEDKKLSVAIATKSLVSTLFHLGINISSRNTPIKTVGLEDLGMEVNNFAPLILNKFKQELTSIYYGKCKVRGVK